MNNSTVLNLQILFWEFLLLLLVTQYYYFSVSQEIVSKFKKYKFLRQLDENSVFAAF